MNVTSSWITNASNQTAIEVTQKSSNTAVAALYWIIFVVGVSGNILLLCVNIWKRSSNQAATQMFVISLAASDLGLLLGTTWINAYLSLSQNFIFGKVMCKLSQMWAFVAGSCSALILSVIGIDRFLSLNKPGNCFISGRVARVIIACVWVGILGVGSPLIVWCDVIPTSGPALSCTTVGVDARTTAIFIVLTRVLTFFFPLGMIFMSYFGIWYKLVFSAKKITDGPSVKTPDQQLSRKVAKMCTLVVAIFVVTWTPFQVDMLYLAYGANKTVARNLFGPSFVTANANSCVNPIIYGFMWKPMRRALAQLFGGFGKHQSATTTYQSTTAKIHPIRETTESNHADDRF